MSSSRSLTDAAIAKLGRRQSRSGSTNRWRAISESVFEAVYDGVRTADLQGHATTTEFTDEVIRRVKTKLAVWPSLGS